MTIGDYITFIADDGMVGAGEVISLDPLTVECDSDHGPSVTITIRPDQVED